MNDVPLFQEFVETLGTGADALEALRAGQIGDGVPVPGPLGPHPLLYADHVASGRALRQIEGFVAERVLPFYANSHTEASFCGQSMTRMRREARRVVAEACGAPEARFATVFAGNGATAGLNRLVSLLGLAAEREAGRTPLVLVGPYEHHSNLLPWREGGAEVVEIDEASGGGPDQAALAALAAKAPGRLAVGAFSISSNVTGIVSDADATTALLKRHGALAVWDYACGAPYLPIDMHAGTPFEKDAVVFSGHKFAGGPGASGVLVLRRDAARRERPSAPGGGTVRFVSPWGHDFSDDLVAREEAGTPDVVGDIRVALCLLAKRAVGQERLDRRHAALVARALGCWSNHPDIVLLGNPAAAARLPIFAFRIRDRARGGFLHPQLVTRLLSDLHGIQARGGCACAGPYAHRLLGIDRARSDALREAILSGNELDKPGWTRLNLSATLSESKLAFILSAVSRLAEDALPWLDRYRADPATARFSYVAAAGDDAAEPAPVAA